jgi:hypothetical protein
MAPCLVNIVGFVVLDVVANILAKFLNEIAIVDTAKGLGKTRIYNVVMFYLKNVSNHGIRDAQSSIVAVILYKVSIKVE